MRVDNSTQKAKDMPKPAPKKGMPIDKISSDDLPSTKARSASSLSNAEKVDISAKAKDVEKANRIARNSPDINEDKVASLKAAIANGTYKINEEAIADRLVDDHLQFGSVA